MPTTCKASTGEATKGERSDRCTDCNKIVTDKDSAVLCEVCEVWFHTSCQNIADDVYKLLKENEALHWYCEGCNRGVAKVIQKKCLQQLKSARKN